MEQFDQHPRLTTARSQVRKAVPGSASNSDGLNHLSLNPLLGFLQPSRPHYTAVTAAHFHLWCREAINRAQNLLELFILIETARWHQLGPSIGSCLDQARASTLFDLYQSLEGCDASGLMPCTPLIRGISSGLVDLFGKAVNDLKIDLKLSSVSLTALKRRALVLMVSELVIDLIIEAFPHKQRAVIFVKLESLGAGVFCLTVHSNSISLPENKLCNSMSLTSQLASILNGEIIYRRSNSGGTRVEIEFSNQH
jgi:hypothetical protein